MWEYYNVTILQCDNIIMWQDHNVRILQCDITMWEYYNVTILQCENIIMWQYQAFGKIRLIQYQTFDKNTFDTISNAW